MREFAFLRSPLSPFLAVVTPMRRHHRPDLLKIPAYSPDLSEFGAMLTDLHAFCGTWDAVCIVLGVPQPAIAQWRYNNQAPSSVAARHIWQTWALICRPGQIQTVFDLATCGRYTDYAGPQHAGTAQRNGKRPKRTRPIKISFTGPPEH